MTPRFRPLLAVTALTLGLTVAAQTPAAAAPKHADVALHLSVTSAPIHPDESFGFEIGLVNNGPARATGVRAEIRLPAGVSDRSGLPCETGPDGASVCTLGPTDIPAGSGAFRPGFAVADEAGSYTISGTVSADQRDRVPANNADSVTFDVVPQTDADVAVELPGDLTANAGAGFGFSIGVRNNGPAEATGVVATVRLPAGLTVAVGPCVPDAGGSVCTLNQSSLPPGFGVASPVLVTATTPGTYRVDGSAAADQPDPVPGNNTGSFVVTVVG
jgi:uncharacterized repeat protein (TIGR01451 family)